MQCNLHTPSCLRALEEHPGARSSRHSCLLPQTLFTPHFTKMASQLSQAQRASENCAAPLLGCASNPGLVSVRQMLYHRAEARAETNSFQEARLNKLRASVFQGCQQNPCRLGGLNDRNAVQGSEGRGQGAAMAPPTAPSMRLPAVRRPLSPSLSEFPFLSKSTSLVGLELTLPSF